jgi:TldD protein
MTINLGRRHFVVGAAGLTAALGTDLLLGCALHNRKPGGATDGIGYFKSFGVDEALIQQALAAALSRGGDYADVFFQHRVSNVLALEDGQVNRAETSVELGVGVRVVKGDQTGYAFTEDLSLESLRQAALTAASIADGPARAAPRSFRVEAGLPQRYPVQTRWEDVRVDQKLPLLQAVNASAYAKDPRVKKVKVSFGDEYGAILLADSNGRLVEDLQPMTFLRTSCVAEQGKQREENSSSLAGRAGLELYTPGKLTEVADLAVARTVMLFEALQPAAGEMPVVLEAGSAGILLHEAIGHGMEADFNRKNLSIYSDKLNKPIAKPFVSIVDDGTNDAARGALNVDDEGNIAGRTQVVDGGVLRTYLHDNISAQHYGVTPTGNGRRESYKFPPTPRMRSTYMLDGPHRREEIIASVKKGIYCQLLSNGQVNIGPGDFSFFVKNGYLIEDGKLTRPIKDVNLIGNGPQVLQQIDMVADDLVIDPGTYNCGKAGQTVPVSVGMPTVRVASITVGGSQSKKAVTP